MHGALTPAPLTEGNIMRGYVTALVVTILTSLAEQAAAQPPPTPGPYRPAATPGVGFYGRSYRAPGFYSIPAPPSYNSVSFYGRNYNPVGFSPVPAPPSTTGVGFYGVSYRAPGFVYFPPGTSAYGPPYLQPPGPGIAVPLGFTLVSNAGAYSSLFGYPPGIQPVSPGIAVPLGFTLVSDAGSYSSLNGNVPAGSP
jgi:hypothetical protein